jgi:hypothetical protein
MAASLNGKSRLVEARLLGLTLSYPCHPRRGFHHIWAERLAKADRKLKLPAGIDAFPQLPQHKSKFLRRLAQALKPPRLAPMPRAHVGLEQ